jgi:hypothetical protein
VAGTFEMAFPLLHLYTSAVKVTKNGHHLAKCLSVLLFVSLLSDAVDWLSVSQTERHHGQ